MRGDVSTAVVTIARIFLHRQPASLSPALHFAVPQFSHFPLFSRLLLSVISTRVRAPRVISRPSLGCLTTRRKKLIRGTTARFAVEV